MRQAVSKLAVLAASLREFQPLSELATGAVDEGLGFIGFRVDKNDRQIPTASTQCWKPERR